MPPATKRGGAKKSNLPPSHPQHPEEDTSITAAAKATPPPRRSSRVAGARARAEILLSSRTGAGNEVVQLPHGIVIKPDPDAAVNPDDAAVRPDDAAVQGLALHPVALSQPALQSTSDAHPIPAQQQPPLDGIPQHVSLQGGPLTPVTTAPTASHALLAQQTTHKPDEEGTCIQDVAAQQLASYLQPHAAPLPSSDPLFRGSSNDAAGVQLKGASQPLSQGKARTNPGICLEEGLPVDLTSDVELVADAGGGDGAPLNQAGRRQTFRTAGAERESTQTQVAQPAGIRIKLEEEVYAQEAGSKAAPQPQPGRATQADASSHAGLNTRQLRRLLLLSSFSTPPGSSAAPDTRPVPTRAQAALSPTPAATPTPSPQPPASAPTPSQQPPAKDSTLSAKPSPITPALSTPDAAPTLSTQPPATGPTPSLQPAAAAVNRLSSLEATISASVPCVTSAVPSKPLVPLTSAASRAVHSDNKVGVDASLSRNSSQEVRTASAKAASGSEGGATTGLSLPPRPRRNTSFTSKNTSAPAVSAGQKPAGHASASSQVPSANAESRSADKQTAKQQDLTRDDVIILDSGDETNGEEDDKKDEKSLAGDRVHDEAGTRQEEGMTNSGGATGSRSRPVRQARRFRAGRQQSMQEQEEVRGEGAQDYGEEHEEKEEEEEDYDLEAVSDDSMEVAEPGLFDYEPVARDFAGLELKPDHSNRPLWVTPDGRIFLETYSPMYKQAYDFLIAIAEPVCRPENVHEYQLTPHSLYAAVSIGLETHTIVSVLNLLSKVKVPQDMEKFIQTSTQNYGKVKLVLKRNRFYVESHDPQILKNLLQDPVIAKAKVGGADAEDTFVVSKALRERAGAEIARRVREAEEDLEKQRERERAEAEAEQDAEKQETQGEGPAQDRGEGRESPQHREEVVHEEMQDPEELEEEVHAFEVQADQVEHVKQRCLPGGLNYPMLEEYDFRNDTVNGDLAADLKPHVRLRPYQQKSLSKMFGNGRARSGIIVLPCGAGKSLVGVAAAMRVRKSCLCLCTSSVSVDQWQYQFKLWSSLQDHQIARFTSENKEMFTGDAGVLVTTFTMISYSGKRSEESEKVMDAIRGREWGLMLLDEVHVVPADIFRKVISIVKAHCKLGLTATLVREDQRIGDLDFLIGPKLYEANWLDLTRAGHIANVQCAEVWCPMTKEFFREYLKPQNAPKKQLLYIMNPNKFMACQFLIEFHERVRGDKIIVFSDNIFALKEYAMRFRKPFIYGPTTHTERTRILHAFKHSPDVNTVFLSKVGDNSLDIPEANVLIQISSHAGSRRQEAQRLGRILRAKRGKPGGGKEEEYNAFFYTLVSKDTQEMYYSSKRQQFLIDQGYSFKVVTNLLDAATASGMHMHCSSYDEQLNLLAKVLSANEDEAGVETLDNDKDDLVQRSGRAAVRRTVGPMSALSGAGEMMYLEYRTGDKRPAPQLGYKSSTAKKMARNLFNN